jgi:hypothetical protein
VSNILETDKGSGDDWDDSFVHKDFVAYASF